MPLAEPVQISPGQHTAPAALQDSPSRVHASAGVRGWATAPGSVRGAGAEAGSLRCGFGAGGGRDPQAASAASTARPETTLTNEMCRMVKKLTVIDGSWHRRDGHAGSWSGAAGALRARRRWAVGLSLLLLVPCRAANIGWQAPLEVAHGAGVRGAWQQNDSRWDFVDDPTAAWNARGELAVAWVDQRRKAVLVRRYAADGATPAGAPVEVSRSPQTFSWLPRLAWAPDDDQRLYVLWQEIVFSGGSHGGEIFFAVSRDAGRSFGPPLNLSNSRAGDGKGRLNRDSWHNGSLDIATAAGGRVWATWTEYDGRLWIARSADAGASFSRPRLVSGEPPAAPARAPALAVGPGLAVVLAWTTGDDPAADIWVALSDDGGDSFQAARPVAVTAGRSDAPKLAFDVRGDLHLVHAESAAAAAGRSVIRHLRSRDGGRSFGMPAEISKPLPVGYGGAAYPAIGSDARGRVMVLWELLRARDQGASYGLGFAVAEDGLHFSPPRLIPGSMDPAGGFNGSTQGLLMNKLAVGADGRIAVVNSVVKIGSHSRVWLLRGVLSGKP